MANLLSILLSTQGVIFFTLVGLVVVFLVHNFIPSAEEEEEIQARKRDDSARQVLQKLCGNENSSEVQDLEVFVEKVPTDFGSLTVTIEGPKQYNGVIFTVHDIGLCSILY